MRTLIHRLFTALVCVAVISAQGAWADNAQTVNLSPEALQMERLEFLQQQLSAFEKDCKGRTSLGADARQDCAKRAGALTQLLAEAHAGNVALKKNDALTMASGCSPDLGALKGAQIDGIGKVLNQLDQKLSCAPGQNTEILSLSCAGEVVDNLTGSIVGLLPGAQVGQSLKSDIGSARGKLSPQTSNCMQELAHGVLVSLVGSAKALWSGVKWVGGKVTDKAASTWKRLTGVEDGTSEKILVASQQSDGALARFKADPVGFVKGLAQSLWSFFNQEMKSEFGCQRWAAVPHHSKCLQEMAGWDCATCNQRMNAVCGAMGAIGGQVVAQVISAFLTGGASAAGEIVAVAAASRAVAVGSKIAEAIPAVGRTASFAGTASSSIRTAAAVSAALASKAAAIGVNGMSKVYSAIQNSSAVQLVSEFAAKASSMRAAAPVLSAANATVKAGAGAVKAVGTASEKYNELLVNATKAGYSSTQTLMKGQSLGAAALTPEAALASLQNQKLARQMGASPQQVSAVERVGALYDTGLQTDILASVQGFQPQAKNRILGAIANWNPKKSNLADSLSRELKSLKSQNFVTEDEIKKIQTAFANDVVNNITGLTDAERKLKAKAVLEIHMPADKITDEMLEGVVKAHYSYAASNGVTPAVGSLRASDLDKVVIELQKAGISDPIIRRDLIKRGLAGVPPDTSEDFLALLKKTVRSDAAESAPLVTEVPKTPHEELASAQAKLTETLSSPNATPWDKVTARQNVKWWEEQAIAHETNSLEHKDAFKELMSRSTSVSLQPSEPVVASEQSPLRQLLNSSVPENESSLSQLLSAPREGDIVPVKVNSGYQELKIVGVDPGTPNKVLLESFTGKGTVSVDPAQIAVSPDARAQAYDQMFAQHRESGDKLLKQMLAKSSNLSVSGAKQKTTEELSKEITEEMVKRALSSEDALRELDAQIAYLKATKGDAATLTPEGQALLAKKSDIEFVSQPFPKFVTDRFEAAIAEINPTARGFTPGEVKYFKELKADLDRKAKSIPGATGVYSHKDTELIDRFNAMLKTPGKNLRRAQSNAMQTANRISREASAPSSRELNQALGVEISRRDYDSLIEASKTAIGDFSSLSASTRVSVREFYKRVSNNPELYKRAMENKQSKYLLEMAKSRMDFEEAENEIARLDRQLENLGFRDAIATH